MDEIELHRLTDEERAALAALPRTRLPNPALEERTVRALRERGLIRSPAKVESNPWRPLVAAAAALVMFAGGVLVGQRLEASEIDDAARVATDPALGIAEVQRANDEWVAALARAGELATADPLLREQVRALAVHGLREAAGLVARIAPDEPVAGEIVRGFTQVEDDATGGDDAAVRHVVWF